MKLSKKQVNHILKLSRLPETNGDSYTIKVNSILEYISKLLDINNADNEKYVNRVIAKQSDDEYNGYCIKNLREDIVLPSLSQEESLLNSGGNTLNGYFKIPKVIE